MFFGTIPNCIQVESFLLGLFVSLLNCKQSLANPSLNHRYLYCEIITPFYRHSLDKVTLFTDASINVCPLHWSTWYMHHFHYQYTSFCPDAPQHHKYKMTLKDWQGDQTELCQGVIEQMLHCLYIHFHVFCEMKTKLNWIELKVCPFFPK